MISMEAILRLNNHDMDKLVKVLELNEDRLYAWLVMDSPTVVREDLDGSIAYVKALREVIKSARPDYVSPCEALLPF